MSLSAIHFPQKRESYFPYFDKIIAKSIHEPIIIPNPIVSDERYWRDYYELSHPVYEWNNGYLEEKFMSDQATFLIYHWFVQVLSMFLHTCPIATFSGLEMGFCLNKTVRKPDLGVVSNDNPVLLLENDRSYHGIFDLCVETLSDSNKQQKERDTITKKAEYAASGVKEYFILHNSEERAFYRLNAQGVYVSIFQREKGVIRSEVLPGFQFRISDLSKRPSTEEMLEDPVYKKFVFPAWQLEKQLRLEAEQHAQEAKQHARIEAALRLEADRRMRIEVAMRLEAEQRAKIEAIIAQSEIARLKALLGLPSLVQA